MARTNLRKLGAGLLFIGSVGAIVSVAARTPGLFRLATECVAVLGIIVWVAGAARR